jgi:uncharacterized tellurite resistance protein B-like protein
MSDLVEQFRFYLDALTDPGRAFPERVSERDLQVATTVLMVQILRADREVLVEEVEAVVDALVDTLGLEHDDAREILRLAGERVASSGALRAAAERLDKHLTRAERIELVERLWRVAFADAELRAHEEYLIRKVAGLLGLSTADLIEAKVRAKEAF